MKRRKQLEIKTFLIVGQLHNKVDSDSLVLKANFVGKNKESFG